MSTVFARSARSGRLAIACAAFLAASFAGGSAAAAHGRFMPAGPRLAALGRATLMHGVAGDRRLIFVTEPGVGSQPRVVALDRRSGRAVGALPAPPGGLRFPFALRIARPGRLAVLDNAGFPPVGAPAVVDYAYRLRGHRLIARPVRTVSFAGLPLRFSEDLEVLPNGDYVVSESVIGGLWLIGRDGAVRPGLVPSGRSPLAALGGCGFPSGVAIGGIPFSPPGGFAPGVGSLAVRSGQLYFGSSCTGGLWRIPLSTLLDTTRPAEQRAAAIRSVSPAPAGTAEVLKGLSFDRWDRGDRGLYAADPFHLRLLRIDVRSGARTVVSANPRLFDFTVSTAFLPPLRGQRHAPLVAVSDQEYRWPGLNGAITRDQFVRPFLLTRLLPAGR